MFITCHTSVTLQKKICMCLSLMAYRVNRGPVLGLSHPASPKWHHSSRLCPRIFVNLQQHDRERNVHNSGGWKDVITGGAENNLLTLASAHFNLDLLIILNTLFQLVAGGPIYTAEYVVVEANCTDDTCVPLDNANAVSKQSISSSFHKKNTISVIICRSSCSLHHYWNCLSNTLL